MDKTTENANEIFTIEEIMFDCAGERTGIFRTREYPAAHDLDADPDSPACFETREEKII